VLAHPLSDGLGVRIAGRPHESLRRLSGRSVEGFGE
jgi:hypothetical protein